MSVIVPVWNGEGVIGRCLAALLTQTLPRDKYEIIVVDNGSTDDTISVLKQFEGIVVLSEPREGSYRARNRGIDVAKGQSIAFTDADCIPQPNWLEEGLSFIKHNPDCSVAAGRIEFVQDQNAKERPSEIYERLFAFDQLRNSIHGSCVTANWMSPTHIIRRHGGFIETLKSGGDEELSRRINDLGGRISYVHTMCVHHPTRSSTDQLCAQRIRTLGGKWDRQDFGFLSWMMRVSARAIREIIMIVRAPQLSPSEKIPVIGVVFTLLITSYRELFRLNAGGVSRRA